MHFYQHLKVLILHLTYLHLSNGNYFSESVLEVMLQRRLVRGISEKAVIDYLEKYVKSVDIESFAGDYYLVQFMDYLNNIITFRHVDPLRQEYAVYDTELDFNTTLKKDVFVLNKNEDHIKVVRDKKTFVVLRRAKAESEMFYVSYIYLKELHDPPTPESHIKEIDGEKYELEWDLWDHKGGKEYKSQLFGQTNCKASIFVPCKADDAIRFPATTFHEKDKEVKTEKTEIFNFVAGKVTLPYLGDDPDSDMDFFYDLDDDSSDSRYVGEKIYNLTESALHETHAPQKESKSPGFLGTLGRGMIGSFMNMGMMVAETFLKVGFGFVKNYQGEYGGLGSKDATLESVVKTVEIETKDGVERWLDDNEITSILAEVRLDTSGGMGGMISQNESKEKPGDHVSDAQFQAARGLLDFLPENVKDPMPDDVVEKVVDAALRDFVDLFSHPGWKTMGMRVEPNVTLNREGQVFVGFSPCNFHEITPDQVKEAKSPEKLIELMFHALRIHCMKQHSDMISHLFEEGFVVPNGQNAFEINPDLNLLKKEKLSTPSTLKLLQAFELAIFSVVYLKEASAPTEGFTAPDGSKLSHSVFVLGNYVKTAIITLRQSDIRVHCVKIRRSLAKTLKSFLVQLIQDKIILERCEKCQEDKTINYNDSVYIMGLMQFIFKGLSLSRNGEDFEKSFSTFYSINLPVFQGKVRSYYT